MPANLQTLFLPGALGWHDYFYYSQVLDLYCRCSRERTLQISFSVALDTPLVKDSSTGADDHWSEQKNPPSGIGYKLRFVKGKTFWEFIRSEQWVATRRTCDHIRYIIWFTCVSGYSSSAKRSLFSRRLLRKQ